MNSKYTFWKLCKTYSKIEVPIIQRDYAQGRETNEVKRIREKFINEFLLDSILDNRPVELDFIYGSILTQNANERKKEVFIPLDGQQRLTTLFLLHYYIALKDKCIDQAKDTLQKFTYETRPTAYNFIKELISQGRPKKLTNIREEIEDSAWFDIEWNNDPSITGMLTMLETFSKNNKLNTYTEPLFEKLTEESTPLISFYFIPLEKFGLTENLYIRMNARGKILSSFENFKSEFYKIISKNHDLQEDIKNKIEYQWVENLWDFREKKSKNEESFVIDKPFMAFLEFITDMLYMKMKPSKSKSYESDFLSTEILNKIYSQRENLKFLIFAFDLISEIKNNNSQDILWEQNTSLHHVFVDVINKNHSILERLILFSYIMYRNKISINENTKNKEDFIRVTRNLINNTPDNSRREWPRLISSIENLIDEDNIYDVLLEKETFKRTTGFSVAQRNEEIFKAKLIRANPEQKKFLFEIEDNPVLEGNIGMILASNYASSEKQLESFDINTVSSNDFNFSKLKQFYNKYKTISKKDFEIIWGDLLPSSIYYQTRWSRLLYNDDCHIHPAVLAFTHSFLNSKNENIDDFLIQRRKSFVQSIIQKQSDFNKIRSVKHQLYLYYIIHTHLYNKPYDKFFRNGFNFGWLAKETGYSSLFDNGIDKDQWFGSVNPIFQTYSSQFRYNSGLRESNAIDIEVVGSGRKNNIFHKLIEWANN